MSHDKCGLLIKLKLFNILNKWVNIVACNLQYSLKEYSDEYKKWGILITEQS
jgi:hypothetical protein